MRFSSLKKLIIIMMLFSVLLGTAACGRETVINGREITDCAGRTVTIPSEPQKIATLDPLAALSVIMYGYGDRMPATVNGVQRDVLLHAICPELKDAKAVKAEGSVNAEEVLALGCDLMFVKEDMYLSEKERAKLDNMGIPYLVIAYESIEQQQDAVRMIGDALNCMDEAELYLQYYNKQLDYVKEKVAEIPLEERPTVYHSFNEALRTDSPISLGADWIKATGLRNVVTEDALTFSEQNYYTSLEQIYVWQPDYILCNETGTPDYIMANAKWAELNAVKNNHVLQVPIGASRWGHNNSLETILAIQWTVKALYGDYFSELDIRAEVDYFYETFFEHEIADDEYEKILSGKGLRESVSSPE